MPLEQTAAAKFWQLKCLDDQDVCIIDLCGYTSPGHFPVSYWADYDPRTGLVHFGGDYREVPPIYVGREPSDSEADIINDYAAWLTGL